MPRHAADSDYDVTDMTPLQELIHNGFLESGQSLIFRYKTEKGRERKFRGTVRHQGILVNRRIYSVSFAAIQCIKSLGDKTAVNGWIAWETEDGESLAGLYQQMRGLQTPPHPLQKFKEQFYKYPRERDVVFVFGAGASYADGAPLQKDLLPTLLTTTSEELSQSPPYRMVVGFLKDNFIWNEKAGRFPALEQVFGFLDYFLYKRESLSKKYSLANIRDVKESLIKLLHYLITTFNDTTSRAYRLFWEYVDRHKAAQILFCKFGLVHSPDLGESSDCMLR